MNTVHTNNNATWFIIQNENIYGGINNFQFTTKMSNSIDALIKVGCNVNQIHNYFQELGINVYEDHIQLYLKHGINSFNKSYSAPETMVFNTEEDDSLAVWESL